MNSSAAARKSFIDLKGLSPHGQGSIQRLLIMEHPSFEEQRLSLALVLGSEDFTWPSLDGWVEHFRAIKFEPSNWGETLFTRPALPDRGLMAKQRELLTRVTPDGLRLLAVAWDGSRQDRVADRLGWSMEKSDAVVQGLAAIGFEVAWKSGAGAIPFLGINDLRTVQKALGLKGARTIEALREIILAGATDQDIAPHVPMPVLVKNQPDDEVALDWIAYVSDVANVVALTASAERARERTRKGLQDMEASHFEIIAARDRYVAPECAAASRRKWRLGERELPPIYPGCRCSAI